MRELIEGLASVPAPTLKRVEKTAAPHVECDRDYEAICSDLDLCICGCAGHACFI